MIVCRHRQVGLANGQHSVGCGEVVVAGAQPCCAADDDGGTHSCGGRCCAASSGCTAYHRIRFSVDKTANGFGEGRIAGSVEAALIVSRHHQVGLANGQKTCDIASFCDFKSTLEHIDRKR